MKFNQLIACLAGLASAAFAAAPLPSPEPENQMAGLPPRASVQTRRPVPASPTPGAVFHVAPRGNDAGPGTKAEPFASLERCRDAIRALKQKGPLPEGGVQVVVHGGEYPVSQTFTLAAEDSGSETTPIRYTAAPGEKPVFQGGKALTGWKRLTRKYADAFPRLPRESRPHVWVADLKACGIATVLPLKLGGEGSGNGFVTHPAHELFFNGTAMPLARGPNEGWLRIKDVEVKDGTKGYDRKGSKTGIFYYEGELPAKWAVEADLLLYGYWFWDWADSYERVASIDPEQRRIALAPPFHQYGYSVGAPFYAVNALCELDASGEWYLDRTEKRLLFYAPTDPNTAKTVLSVTAAPLMALENVSHVRFEGIAWELGSADGIRIRGGDHCLLAGCTVERFAGNGVEIQGGRENGLLSCDIGSMGRGGVVVAGGNRKTLEPGANFVENCEIHELSRIDHTYTPGILLNGVGHRVAHNRLHDIASSALRVAGNDHVIEYNEVYHAVTESDDQGGADLWGDPTYQGIVFRFNYWHHIGARGPAAKQPKCGQNGVRLDDAISGVLVYGNVFESCAQGGFGAVQVHGGKDNVIENNLFLDCAAGVSLQPWAEDRWQAHVDEYLARNEINLALYLQRYPPMASLRDHANTNTVRRNLTLRCGAFLPKTPPGLQAEANDGTLEDGFSMQTAPAVYKHPGIDPIPLGEIGLYRDAWRK